MKSSKAFELLDCKAEKVPLTNWYYEELDRGEIDQLVVGDCVRLLLQDPVNNNCWEKIYFEIVQIDYYSKGGVNKPRKFHGKALDTYRLIYPLPYVQTGEVITFQKCHVLEIPKWRTDIEYGNSHNSSCSDGSSKSYAVPKQPNAKLLDKEKELNMSREMAMEEIEWEKARRKEQQEKESLKKTEN